MQPTKLNKLLQVNGQIYTVLFGSDFFAILKRDGEKKEEAEREEESPIAADSHKGSDVGKAKPGGTKSPKGCIQFSTVMLPRMRETRM